MKNKSKRALALNNTNTVIEEVTLIISTAPEDGDLVCAKGYSSIEAVLYAIEQLDVDEFAKRWQHVGINSVHVLGHHSERLQLSEINNPPAFKLGS